MCLLLKTAKIWYITPPYCYSFQISPHPTVQVLDVSNITPPYCPGVGCFNYQSSYCRGVGCFKYNSTLLSRCWMFQISLHPTVQVLDVNDESPRFLDLPTTCTLITEFHLINQDIGTIR